MSEQNVSERDAANGSPLLSRSTIVILVAILLIHSGAIAGIIVGRVVDNPISIMCLLSAVAGLISFLVVCRRPPKHVDGFVDRES